MACSPASMEVNGDGEALGTVRVDEPGSSVADSGPGADSGTSSTEGSEHDGEYLGWYEMVVTIWGYPDTCEGQAQVVMDAESESQITGESSCEFHGWMADKLELRDTYFSTLQGNLTEGSAVEGVMESDLGSLETLAETWTGEFDDGKLTGGVSGSTAVTIEGYDIEIEFEAEFSVTR